MDELGCALMDYLQKTGGRATEHAQHCTQRAVAKGCVQQ